MGSARRKAARAELKKLPRQERKALRAEKWQRELAIQTGVLMVLSFTIAFLAIHLPAAQWCHRTGGTYVPKWPIGYSCVVQVRR